MFDIEFAKFEIEHFHNLFQVAVASLDNFLSLLKPQLDNVELVCVHVKGDDVELAFKYAHFYDALDVVLSDHAKISPQDFSGFIKKSWSMHVHRRFTNQDLEHSLIARKHRLRNSISCCLRVHLL